MAHEIKNPLTSIKTFTEYFPEKYNNPDFREKFNNIVGGEVDRINTIVKQLLEFSRPTEPDLKKSDINKLMDETLALLNNDLLKRDIKVKAHYSPLPSINVDPAQVKQVFLNIILNAIEAMRGGGTLTVRTGTIHEQAASITISDTGKGIGKEDLKHIFDPFFSRKDGGTGLGLSVVHGIIRKHGGKISAESTPGKGTALQITLPS
jgi:signal transduction histidine kinase